MISIVARVRGMQQQNYRIEADDVYVMEQMGEELNHQRRIDSTATQQSHRRPEIGQHQSGGRFVVDILGHELIQCLRQIEAKAIQ